MIGMLLMEYLFTYLYLVALIFCPNFFLYYVCLCNLLMFLHVGLYYLWATNLKIQMILLSLTFVLHHSVVMIDPYKEQNVWGRFLWRCRSSTNYVL